MSFAVKADPLIVARARIADLELILSQARAFVRHDANHPAVTPEFQGFARQVLVRIDRALDGTLHSFTPNGARR